VCYTIPYTYSNLREFLDQRARNPLVTVENLGVTRCGRDLPLVTVGEDDGVRDLIVMICREDGDEPTSNCALEGMIDRLAGQQEPALKEMLSGCAVKVVPMVAIDAVDTGSPYGGPYDVMARRWMDEELLPEIQAIRDAIDGWIRAGRVRLAGKLHGGQTYDNSPVWDFRVFDELMRTLIPKQYPENPHPDWNPILNDAVLKKRKLTIIETYLQETHDFWNFFSVHTNGADPEQLRRQGAHFADLLADYCASASLSTER
jgi:hypothetical protein